MQNKEAAYIQMMTQHQAVLYKIASLYTNCLEDREDLMQEMAYQLWRSFDSFEYRSNLGTWLYRVCMNTALHFLKKEKRQLTTQPLDQSILWLGTNPTDNAQESALQQMLQAIQQLKALDKGIILLYLEEKSHQEIAAIVGISVSNVGTRIHRIKQQLKNNTKP